MRPRKLPICASGARNRKTENEIGRLESRSRLQVQPRRITAVAVNSRVFSVPRVSEFGGLLPLDPPGSLHQQIFLSRSICSGCLGWKHCAGRLFRPMTICSVPLPQADLSVCSSRSFAQTSLIVKTTEHRLLDTTFNLTQMWIR